MICLVNKTGGHTPQPEGSCNRRKGWDRSQVIASVN